ncbi:hypothetical protein BIY29_11830 [Brenneria alni]|uniref:DUF1778 domain-containing protein n=1 Tax=Brenneria alni TaxID=71656 RepID=A0A421DMZ7_9GAMM|nr:hypothetical protein BIY29_11830 [Brenneria alni]
MRANDKPEDINVEAEISPQDQRLFVVDDVQFASFIVELKKPIICNESLRALLDKKSSWE